MATTAIQRLKTHARIVSGLKVCAVELPKFRYLDDINRFLDSMAKDIDELGSLAIEQQKLLSYLKEPKTSVKSALLKAATFSFDITDDAGDKKTHLRRKIDPELTKVVVPNITKLREQYGLSEDLYERYRTLEAIETQLSMQFPDRRGEAYNKAEAAIAELKSKVQAKLKEVLEFLNEVAAKHVPKTFVRYREAIMQEVEEHVNFEDSDQFMYVSTTEDGELVFTNYIMLKDAQNDEGRISPHLYISIQWIVGSQIQVQVNHEFELPNILLKEGGEVVSSVGEAVKAISQLLDLEDFSTSLGTVPLSTQLLQDPSKLTPNMFSYKDFIKKVVVDTEKLIFQLRPDVTDEEVNEIKYPLYNEVRQLFKRARKVKLRMKISRKEIEFDIVNVAERGEVSRTDAEFLAHKFGLNEQQVRKVVNILNSGER